MRRIHWTTEKQNLFWPQVTFFDDGLATIHDCSFLDDQRFQSAYRVGQDTGSWRGTNNQWRVHTLCWVADQAKRLDGDFVECGVYRGGSARTVIDFVNFSALSKRYFLLDTFEGIPDEAMNQLEKKHPVAKAYEPTYEAVRKTFAPFPEVKIIRGPVPQVLPQVDSEKIAFLHLDMNCAAPEIAAAEAFWERLVPGGLVLLDDYAYHGFPTQRRAFDDFAQRHKTSILTLPTGQGLMMR